MQRQFRKDATLGRRPATLVLTGFVSFSALAGCATDHRIPMAKFVAMQKAAPPAIDEALTPDLIVDVEQQLGPYVVGPGDVISVTLTRADQIPLFPPVQVRIDRNGEINLPIVGAVNVAGLALDELDARIRSAYIPAVVTEGVVFTDLVQPEGTEVLVVGAVAAPGLVPLRRNERNLLYAIVTAGGVSDLASGKATLRRIRRPHDLEFYDLTSPLGLQEALAAPPLEDGDVVLVDAATPNTVFVGGLVLRSGPQTYPTGTDISILQALAAAGGYRTDVYPTEGTLIRRLEDGSDIQVKLQLNRIARGEMPNLELEPGDILWVPHTLETRVQEWFNRNVFFRAGASVTYTATGVEFLNRQNQQGGRAFSQEQAFDPLGFLNRNSALRNITTFAP